MNTKPMLTAVAAALFSLGACVSAQAADLSTCTTCHSNITKAHAGAAHKDIACTSCHSGVDQHLKKVTDRPTVNMDPATCGGCHQAPAGASNPRTAGSMPRSTAASPTRFGMF